MKKFFQKYKGNILRAFVELLVIFVGITISLLIDDWRQQRADDELAKQYMRSMYRDVSIDLMKLADQTLDRMHHGEDCRIILQALHFPDSIKITQEDFRDRFGNATRLTKFVSSDNTFQDLTATGNMKLINNIELKNYIYTYYRAVDELKELEEINNDASSRLSVDVITSEFSVRSVYHFGSIYAGAEDLQFFDMTFFNDPNSNEYKRLEDVILFRHIFLSMELRKFKELWFPLYALREKLCELSGIPTFGQYVDELRAKKSDAILLYNEYIIDYPDLILIEGELNEAGYAEMNNENYDLALQLFSLAVHLYPESPNAYDSLGDIYYKMADYENSKINYQKALELDPELESSLERINEINEKLNGI